MRSEDDVNLFSNSYLDLQIMVSILYKQSNKLELLIIEENPKLTTNSTEEYVKRYWKTIGNIEYYLYILS